MSGTIEQARVEETRRTRHRDPTDRVLDAQRAKLHWWWHEATASLFEPIVRRALKWTWPRHLPEWAFGKPAATPTWRSLKEWDTPQQFRTVRGAMVDPEEQERVFRERPFYDFFALFPESGAFFMRYCWAWLLPSLRITRLWQVRLKAGMAPARKATHTEPLDPQALTDEIRARALALGINAIGFASYDPRYTFVETPLNEGPLSTGSVIVTVLEQDFDVTQAIPTSRAERSIMRTYLQHIDKALILAEMLHERGIEAQVQGPAGRLASIPYAVQAGLGQLGLNGQLLTPVAGSRARLCLITTDTTLVHDEPADFGIHAICDQCQLCVKRCPSGAIPKTRSSHRGVIKAKIKPERCVPVLTQAHGCAICMKVCPVQRYGLEAVTNHLVETGEILGKGTDELEGFHWIDSRHYGPGQKPKISKEFMMTPLGITLERNRQVPPQVADEESGGHVVA